MYVSKYFNSFVLLYIRVVYLLKHPSIIIVFFFSYTFTAFKMSTVHMLTVLFIVPLIVYNYARIFYTSYHITLLCWCSQNYRKLEIIKVWVDTNTPAVTSPDIFTVTTATVWTNTRWYLVGYIFFDFNFKWSFFV